MGSPTKNFIKERIKLPEQILQLRELSLENNIPIISDEVANIIKIIIKIKKPKELLEVGTATGYSSIFFALSYDNLKITSIERDHERFLEAKKNILAFNLEERIELLEGDAFEVIPKIKKKYDILFLDGAKSKYLDVLEESLTLLKQGSIVIGDNVLFKGMVAGEVESPKKHRIIVKNLRKFLDYINNSEDFTSTILPVGDGLSISIYEGEER